MSDSQKLEATLKAIAQTFNLAADEPFILNIIRTMPEKDIRHVLEVLADEDFLAFLSCFEDLQEYEWCRVIHAVATERRINLSR